jgi:hypothetical protein
MESYIHNGETISLPVIAPADAPVTAKNVILNRTFETIENHEGGNKFNWSWKTQVLINRFKTISTSSVDVLIAYDIAGINTDCSLHLENLHHDLSKGNAGELHIPDDSRCNVRWFSMTQHFQPRQVHWKGKPV